MQHVLIGQHKIGAPNPCYIVAEMSGNHNQSYDKALEIIHAAKEAGADAVKVQTYTPDTITINCNSEYFRIKKGSLWSGQNLYDLYKGASTPWEWQPKLKKEAEKLEMAFFSTPFDKTAVDFLHELDVSAYKIASFELIDLQLIKYTAEKGKPVILSTGMGSLNEITEAVNTVLDTGNSQLILLKCVSDYPANPEEMNLKAMPYLNETFKTITGLSDHSPGFHIAVAAVVLGASIIEKHLTISRKEGGPDAAFSMEPAEFKDMVTAIRQVEKSIGEVKFEPTKGEMKNLIFRRSLFVVDDVKKGDLATDANVRSIRPGYGLEPKYLTKITGCKFNQDLIKGTPLHAEHLDGFDVE